MPAFNKIAVGFCAVSLTFQGFAAAGVAAPGSVVDLVGINGAPTVKPSVNALPSHGTKSNKKDIKDKTSKNSKGKPKHPPGCHGSGKDRIRTLLINGSTSVTTLPCSATPFTSSPIVIVGVPSSSCESTAGAGGSGSSSNGGASSTKNPEHNEDFDENGMPRTTTSSGGSSSQHTGTSHDNTSTKGHKDHTSTKGSHDPSNMKTSGSGSATGTNTGTSTNTATKSSGDPTNTSGAGSNSSKSGDNNSSTKTNGSDASKTSGNGSSSTTDGSGNQGSKTSTGSGDAGGSKTNGDQGSSTKDSGGSSSSPISTTHITSSSTVTHPASTSTTVSTSTAPDGKTSKTTSSTVVPQTTSVSTTVITSTVESSSASTTHITSSSTVTHPASTSTTVSTSTAPDGKTSKTTSSTVVPQTTSVSTTVITSTVGSSSGGSGGQGGNTASTTPRMTSLGTVSSCSWLTVQTVYTGCTISGTSTWCPEMTKTVTETVSPTITTTMRRVKTIGCHHRPKTRTKHRHHTELVVYYSPATCHTKTRTHHLPCSGHAHTRTKHHKWTDVVVKYEPSCSSTATNTAAPATKIVQYGKIASMPPSNPEELFFEDEEDEEEGDFSARIWKREETAMAPSGPVDRVKTESVTTTVTPIHTVHVMHTISTHSLAYSKHAEESHHRQAADEIAEQAPNEPVDRVNTEWVTTTVASRTHTIHMTHTVADLAAASLVFNSVQAEASHHRHDDKIAEGEDFKVVDEHVAAKETPKKSGVKTEIMYVTRVFGSHEGKKSTSKAKTASAKKLSARSSSKSAPVSIASSATTLSKVVVSKPYAQSRAVNADSASVDPSISVTSLISANLPTTLDLPTSLDALNSLNLPTNTKSLINPLKTHSSTAGAGKNFRIRTSVLCGDQRFDNLTIQNPADPNVLSNPILLPEARTAAHFFIDRSTSSLAICCKQAQYNLGLVLVRDRDQDAYGDVLFSREVGTARVGQWPEQYGVNPGDTDLPIIWRNDRFGSWLACQKPVSGTIELKWWDVITNRGVDQNGCAKVELIAERFGDRSQQDDC